MQEELRGYAAGRYIDRKMLATQLEYGRSLPWRLGVAAFGGVGEVGPELSQFDYKNLLPSGGIGPRFMLTSKFHVNLRRFCLVQQWQHLQHGVGRELLAFPARARITQEPPCLCA